MVRHGALLPSLVVLLGGGLASCSAGADPDPPPMDGGGGPVPDGGHGEDADGAHDDAEGSLPSLEVGAGEDGFEPLEDGDPLALYMGFQGGWHVYPGVRVSGVPPEETVLTYLLEDPDTGEAVTFERTITLAEDRVLWVDDGWERFGDALVIMGVDTDVLGRTLTLVATLTPPEGGPPWHDARQVTIVEPP